MHWYVEELRCHNNVISISYLVTSYVIYVKFHFMFYSVFVYVSVCLAFVVLNVGLGAYK